MDTKVFALVQPQLEEFEDDGSPVRPRNPLTIRANTIRVGSGGHDFDDVFRFDANQSSVPAYICTLTRNFKFFESILLLPSITSVSCRPCFICYAQPPRSPHRGPLELNLVDSNTIELTDWGLGVG